MDALDQLNSALVGRYEVVREIGRGGMAVVYLAQDVRHHRQVAIKVLDPELGALLGVTRFLGEIEVTAALQHPNLVPLFDSGEADGLLFYVMPFVEGESLRSLLDREKQLPVSEAVHIAVSIAGALEYAHRHGVVHRDLKPENILLQSREPLIADFGIALAVSNAGGARLTQTGLTLGTPQYMSPEQAAGDREIDGRSDIYSLAVVLYEMLTGDPPHMASTAQGIIARVLHEKPSPVRTLRESVPPFVDRAIAQGLGKLPADRFPTAAAFADAVRGDASAPVDPRAELAIARGTAWPWAIACLLLAGIALWGWLRPRDVHVPVTKFVVELQSDDRNNYGLALSSSGTLLAYGGPGQLSIRSMSSLAVRPVPATAHASYPFFSPDGQSIGVFSAGKLLRISVATGTQATLVDSMPDYHGGSWGAGDRIVYAAPGGLMLVSGTGGTPRRLTRVAAGQLTHLWPSFLPGGRGVLFTVGHGDAANTELAVTTLDGRITLLGLKGTSPQFADGHVVFARADGMLAIAPFDLASFRVGAERAAGEIVRMGAAGAAAFALSPNGTLLTAAGVLPKIAMLVDRAGATQPLALESRAWGRPRFSPDGSRILLDTRPAGQGEIWIYDTRSATAQRLFVGDDVHQPEWRPDGKQIAFTANSDSTGEDLFIMPVDGSAPPSPLFRQRGDQYDGSWAPDGRTLVFVSDLPSAKLATFTLGDRAPLIWYAAPFPVLGPRVSPDGHWLAYWTSESGRNEVLVRPFPANGGVVQASSGGGSEPVWSRDGRMLYYRQGDKLVATTFTATPEHAVAARRVLFSRPFSTDVAHAYYDVSPDGRSFVFLQDDPSQQNRLVVTINWLEDMLRVAGTGR